MQAREGAPGLQVIGFLLFAALLVAAINFYRLTALNENDRAAIQHATDIQVFSQQIAKHATDAVSGNLEAEESFELLQITKEKIASRVTDLNQGNAQNKILPPADSLLEQVSKMRGVWLPMEAASDFILGKNELVLGLRDTREQFAARIPLLSAKMDEVVQILTGANAPSQQIYQASRQLVLADRMLRRVNEIVQGGEAAMTAADGFGRDTALFGRTLTGLLNGNEEMKIRAIENPTALNLLGDVFRIYEEIGQDVDEILQASTEMFDIKLKADEIFAGSQTLLDEATLVVGAVNNLVNERTWPSVFVGAIASGLALLLIVLLLSLFYRDQRRRLQSTAELNQRNQEAILRLLDEMGSLAEGDLTVKATVTEDITGAIADSINFAVEALRSLVTTINETAVQVAAAAQETQATAMHLAEAAEHQAQQITSASAAINEIAVSIDEVSRNSAESADVAQRSVQLAMRGAEVVRETIRGMDNIREQIQETSKRIKRLGESSQEIGDIVELINDIAEQTNILALNAAIQAASAGDAGRGFAVVADEVQRLAERASNATKRIETLVQTIQADTNEAVISMEQTTTEVVKGARRAEDAGLALGEIEKVSHDLAELIQNISEAARQQSAAATNISGTMNVIQEITTQTSAGTSQTAESIGILADLARDLRKSVADFKLPT